MVDPRTPHGIVFAFNPWVFNPGSGFNKNLLCPKSRGLTFEDKGIATGFDLDYYW